MELGAESAGVTVVRPPGHSTVDEPSAVARAPAPCHITHRREEEGERARGRKEGKVGEGEGEGEGDACHMTGARARCYLDHKFPRVMIRSANRVEPSPLLILFPLSGASACFECTPGTYMNSIGEIQCILLLLSGCLVWLL